jgi:hypothetical protein
MLQLPNDSEAPLKVILFDVRENFVGAGSAELRAESRVWR